MSHRAPAASIATAHALALLGEYTHTLDSLPLDLSRNFADLRELDAVLSSSMASLTGKITQLTTMLENNVASKEERLWLLADIAEEATRLKLGGEDKIRVACHAADGLRGHNAHMKTLLHHIPDPDFEAIDRLCRKTVYPHVATRSYMPVGGAGEGGRRQRRGVYGNLLTSASHEVSPSKRKRTAGRDEDPELVGKMPRKERNGDVSRQRNTARNKRTERVASPAESLVSVASHLPPAAHPRSNGAARGANGSSNKPSRAVNGDQDIFNAPPSSSAAHPSLPVPYANGLHNLNNTHVVNGVNEWAHGQLEGPGMPVARSFMGAVVVEPTDGAGADADGGIEDERTYCFCNRVSYGDMIACDEQSCEREWFHLPCIGLTVPPEGTWYCEACRAKRNARRSGRGWKKRTGGGRSNARNTSA